MTDRVVNLDKCHGWLGDRHAHQREVKIPPKPLLTAPQRLLGAHTLHELTDLTADRGDHFKKGCVRLQDNLVEEFHDPEYIFPVKDREGKGAAQTTTVGLLRPEKVSITLQVAYPVGAAKGPHVARQP